MRLRGLLLTLTTSCLFGLGAVLAKPLGEGFQPFFVSWLALLGGGLCILICQVLRRKPLLPQMTRASWIDLLLFASIGTALPLVCIIVGLCSLTHKFARMIFRGKNVEATSVLV